MIQKNCIEQNMSYSMSTAFEENSMLHAEWPKFLRAQDNIGIKKLFMAHAFFRLA